MNKGLTMERKTKIILAAMTLIIVVLFVTFGKYSTTLGGTAYAQIAEPKTALVTGGSKIEIDHGQVGSYQFAVTNLSLIHIWYTDWSGDWFAAGRNPCCAH